MTEIHIDYDTAHIKAVIDAVDEHNASPENERKDNRDISVELMHCYGDKLAVQGDPNSDCEEQNTTEYLLTVVPEWCNDDSELDGSNDETIKRIFDEFYLETGLSKPSDLWHSKLQIIVLVHDWSTMTARHLTLKEFGDEMAGYVSADFGNE